MQKILIVEDEHNLGDIYASYLKSSGYEVKFVRTVEEAEASARSFRADLLLIDHGMPQGHKDGVDALPTLKKKFPRARLIIFSNFSNFDLQEQAFGAGADEYWVKLDFSLEELAESVNRILRGHNRAVAH